MNRMKNIEKLVLQAALLLAMSAVSFAQAATETQSLGDVARKNRAKQPAVKAKLVADNDSLHKSSLPIPDIRSEGDYNTEEIVAAIVEYRNTHDPKQTEEMVRAWYDRQDSAAAAAIESNRLLQSRNTDPYYDQRPNSGTDYRKYQEEQRDRAVLARNEQQQKQANDAIIFRFSNTIGFLRSRLAGYKLAYEWLKPHYVTGAY